MKPVKFISLDCVNKPQSRFLNLWKANFERDGHDGSWFFASRRPRPILSDLVGGGPQQQIIRPDAAIIVPGIEVGNEIHLVVIKELRIPLGGYEYCFPAGLVDDGESVEEAARRELFEETGLTAGDFSVISPVLFSSAGSTDECVQILFTLATGVPSNHNQESSEDIEVLVLSPERVRDLCNCKGEFAGAYLAARAWPIMMLWGQCCHACHKK